MGNSLLGQASLSTYQPNFREKASDWLRGLLFSDDREGQRKAERLLGVLETTTPVGVATGLDDMREAAGQGDYATAGLMGAMAMVPGPSPKIKAYHGSPHSFDRFSMDKIGTGEGAQAYGHGLYFAENERVAKGYRDTLSANTGVKSRDNAVRMVGMKGGDRAAAIEQTQNNIRNMEARVAEQTPPNVRNEWMKRLDEEKQILNELENGDLGSMYEVEINASPDDFLDWDKPLSEQPEKARTIIEQMIGAPAGSNRMLDAKFLASPAKDGSYKYAADGSRIVNELALGDRAGFSNKLREAGIPGIKYLDAGSRPPQYGPDVQYLLKEFGSKEKALEVAKQRLASAHSPREQIKAQEAVDALSIPETRNYVVFDENLINIVRKYGIAGASAMLGYNILEGASPAEAKQLQNIETASQPLLGGQGW